MPDPERPTTATTSPGATDSEAPSSTRRAARPRPWALIRPRALRTSIDPRLALGAGHPRRVAQGRWAAGHARAASKRAPIAMSPARAPKAKKRKPPARARRSGLRVSLPVLEQHHFDLIGLGLVAMGVFLAFPLYLGWNGGTVGEAVADAHSSAAGRR